MAAKYRVTLNFDIEITDEVTFAQVVHETMSGYGQQLGGLSGMGTENTQEAADMVGQDQRMGASAWSVAALSVGLNQLPGADLVGMIESKNEPLD